MPQKLFGLVAGNNDGPWMHTPQFRFPHVVIRGLPEGKGLVSVRRFVNDGEKGATDRLTYTRDGKYPVERADKMKFEYEGESAPDLQCLIVSR